MIDNVYQNAFKEVFIILENTDENVLKRIPSNFIKFIKNNMNNEYVPNISISTELDKQHLLKETEAVLSLIYRSYLATDEEKLAFFRMDKENYIKEQELKKKQYKDISEIFNEKQRINQINIDRNLAVIEKGNFFKKLFKKISKFFKRG